MNKFKPGQILLVKPLSGLYKLSFHDGKHALYIEPLDDSTLHRVMIDNELHIVTEGEIRELAAEKKAK